MRSINKILLYVSILTIALAFVESAVVVYLREIYYPEGFNFPPAQFSLKIAITEIIRESCTIIILFSICWLSDKRFILRFAYFIYCFAIWDIFYYVFLKLILNWPESFFTWDVLFLIPTTWTAPVIAPIIVSITMIGFAALIFILTNEKIQLSFNRFDWLLLISGSVILIIAFIWDYSSYIFQYFSFSELLRNLNSEKVSDIAIQYKPEKFNWWLFLTGEILILADIIIFGKRNYKSINS